MEKAYKIALTQIWAWKISTQNKVKKRKTSKNAEIAQKKNKKIL